MARPHSIFSTFAALLLLGVMVLVFVAMGNWQTRRAAERDTIGLAIQQGRGNAPIQLTPHTPIDQLVDWRPALVKGRWQHELTVLLDNRNYKGHPGYWVATPLLLDAASNTAVLVLRGWLARTPSLAQALPLIPTPSGTQMVTGEMLHHVPRLFELWTFSDHDQSLLPAQLPSAATPLPSVQNLKLSAYAAATGLKLLPIVLEQTASEITIPNAATPTSHAPSNPSGMAPLTVGTPLAAESTPAVLIREWPEPSINADKNRGYAVQWYGFALIAAGAWLFLAWHAWRRRRSPLG